MTKREANAAANALLTEIIVNEVPNATVYDDDGGGYIEVVLGEGPDGFPEVGFYRRSLLGNISSFEYPNDSRQSTIKLIDRINARYNDGMETSGLFEILNR